MPYSFKTNKGGPTKSGTYDRWSNPSSWDKSANRGTSCIPNFNLDMEMTIQSRSIGEVSTRIFAINESGISAALPLELPIGETLDLVLHLPMGTLKVKAVVRSKDSLRHRFEFVDLNIPLDLMRGSQDAVGHFRLLLVLAYVAGCNWRSSATLQS